jgi:hypothetical protein
LQICMRNWSNFGWFTKCSSRFVGYRLNEWIKSEEWLVKFVNVCEIGEILVGLRFGRRLRRVLFLWLENWTRVLVSVIVLEIVGAANGSENAVIFLEIFVLLFGFWELGVDWVRGIAWWRPEESSFRTQAFIFLIMSMAVVCAHLNQKAAAM